MGIKEIKELFQFLECDMPSKIFPDETIKGEVWTREDKFENKEEVIEYLEQHFLIAFPELKKHSPKN